VRTTPGERPPLHHAANLPGRKLCSEIIDAGHSRGILTYAKNAVFVCKRDFGTLVRGEGRLEMFLSMPDAVCMQILPPNQWEK